MLLPCRAVSRLIKRLMALLINSSTGMTLASQGKLCISDFWGLGVLFLQDSLQSSTHEGVPGWLMHPWETLLLWNSKEMKCCLYETPYVAAPVQVLGDVIANSTPYVRLPTDAPTRARFIFGSRVTRFVRDPSRHIKTPTWNFYKEIYVQRWYQNGLLITFLEEPRNEYLKRLCKQTPLWLVVMRKSLRNPEEQANHKKRDIEKSAPTHVHHTHCAFSQLGTTANQRCDVPQDWLQEACHMARVCWGTCCKGFRSKECPHYRMEQSARNHLERNQVQRAPEKSSSSRHQTSNNQSYSRVWKSLWDSFPKLYCIDLAEAYITRESFSSRI